MAATRRNGFARSGSHRRSPMVANILSELNKATVHIDQMIENWSPTGLSTRAAALGNPGYDSRRDMNADCGWPPFPGIELYSDLFERDAIANRVITAFPDECFAIAPDVFDSLDEADTTPFEARWDELVNTLPIHNFLHQCDINAGIGQFGLGVIGFDDGLPLDKPLLDNYGRRDNRRKPANPIWLQSYDERSVHILNYVDDSNSPQYGKPEFYQVTLTNMTLDSSNQIAPADLRPVKIHWSRALHVLTGQKRSSEVFAIPRLKPVLNRILDLRKLYGGSAEAIWQGGFMGLSIESLPNVDLEELSPDDLASIKKQLQAYMNSQQRYIALSGMTAKPLHPQHSDPSKHIDKQLEAICACLRIPLRVFLGAATGQQASVQESVIWNNRVRARQLNVLDPRLVRPLVNRFLAVGAMPQPQKKRYYTGWTDLNATSDTDKAEIAMKKAQAVTQYVTSGAETILPPVHFFSLVMGLPITTAEALVADAKKTVKKTMTKEAWAKNKQQSGPPPTAQKFGKRPARNAKQGAGRSKKA